MRHLSRDEHYFGPGPKRILSLDGGGLRGVLTLAFLERLETILRERHGGDPDFRLSDYFDLIAGTSTGAIIAAGLATGRSTTDIKKMYHELGRRVFRKMPWRIGIFSPKFDIGPLKTVLADQLGDMPLGSEDIRTGLLLVSKRLDTGSVWPIHNNPRGKYFEAPEDDPIAKPNKDLLLRDVIRASCAAPHYFEPEVINIGHQLTGAFIDGSVSPYSNPALLSLMFATLKGYGVNWALGEDKLLLVSLGTGYQQTRLAPEEVMKMTTAFVGARALMSVLHDCNMLTQTVLQWLAATPIPQDIDSEIGDLASDDFAGGKWATYLRYDVLIEPDWLEHNLGISVTPREASDAFAMDRFEYAALLSRIGEEAARIQLQPNHFAPHFDLD